jgi:hypothetical protein
MLPQYRHLIASLCICSAQNGHFFKTPVSHSHGGLRGQSHAGGPEAAGTMFTML